VTPAEFERMIAEGEMTDAHSICAWFLVKLDGGP
jgi:hypothetical protein